MLDRAYQSLTAVVLRQPLGLPTGLPLALLGDEKRDSVFCLWGWHMCPSVPFMDVHKTLHVSATMPATVEFPTR